MQLTRFTDFGLRVLMYLAVAPRDVPATIPEIADRFAISRNHLVKVVHFMAQQGWIVTTRGKGGGLRLARPAAEINLGAVVRLLEPAHALIDCADPPCALRFGCRLKGVLDSALDAFYATLDAVTLADLMQEPTGSAIVRLHGRSPQPA
ncbi:RrF2 family transcriptional regulator [Crenobacter cavernae]|uniref:Rrf2 family transcriptional regulator n=1 Tax=Crenobacter cavernae TaxID=2290923 RepID=A0ABY0FFU9_9NEIS|nr:Rrf2 family transcriptional regulator [Crenobacter cavernae]RXZ44979.1 Rrf2 family transcriptional regulator [Crenobacter cavernae]